MINEQDVRRSAGFTSMFTMFSRELNEDYLGDVQHHLSTLRFRQGVLFSAKLGDSNETAGYALLKPHGKDPNWFERLIGMRQPGYTYQLDPHDEAGGRIMSEMRSRAISRVARALAQSADHVVNFFKMLRTELAFYIGCLNLHDALTAKGLPEAFPESCAPGEQRHNFSGLYDVSLALQMQARIVANSGNADGKNPVIITGANQGGKSTFLRSIGLAQIMMQCGLFVGAESFTAELCPALLTHYKREEDTTMKSGKLDEELARMSEIINHVKPHSLLLLNESFAATNEREGSEIARQIVSALLDKGMKVFFVTHLHEFARIFYERHGSRSVFLRPERLQDGTRTFKLVEAPPLEASYAEDLYLKVFAVGAEEVSRT
jgi:DNA mismatch repair ATPase MutS